MAEQTREEMKKYMVEFLKTMNDYVPEIGLEQEGKIIGCLNVYYHGGIGSSLVYPPIKERGGVSIVSPTMAYVLMSDLRIFVILENLDYYDLDACLGNSYELVFIMLKEAYLKKIKNE